MEEAQREAERELREAEEAEAEAARLVCSNPKPETRDSTAEIRNRNPNPKLVTPKRFSATNRLEPGTRNPELVPDTRCSKPESRQPKPET